MPRRNLQNKAVDFAVDDFLELFNYSSVKFVELVLGKHLADELPQYHILARTLLVLLVLDLLD